MNLNTTALANCLLGCNNICLPMYNNHYITGKGIYLFGTLACVENTLGSATCSLKQCCQNLGFNNTISYLSKPD